ncbi:hypothetical protein C1646_688552 [Rhizophagus diaphanus]|nr:hypothetical protein C1646_688552 [Rhizophagus diaphanus] [Rhizophagus sp. MUCL 43196]
MLLKFGKMYLNGLMKLIIFVINILSYCHRIFFFFFFIYILYYLLFDIGLFLVMLHRDIFSYLMIR